MQRSEEYKEDKLTARAFAEEIWNKFELIRPTGGPIPATDPMYGSLECKLSDEAVELLSNEIFVEQFRNLLAGVEINFSGDTMITENMTNGIHCVMNKTHNWTLKSKLIEPIITDSITHEFAKAKLIELQSRARQFDRVKANATWFVDSVNQWIDELPNFTRQRFGEELSYRLGFPISDKFSSEERVNLLAAYRNIMCHADANGVHHITNTLEFKLIEPKRKQSDRKGWHYIMLKNTNHWANTILCGVIPYEATHMYLRLAPYQIPDIHHFTWRPEMSTPGISTSSTGPRFDV